MATGKVVNKTTVYYGPGTSYPSENSFAGPNDSVTIFWLENGYYYIEYPAGTKKKRMYIIKSAVSSISGTVPWIMMMTIPSSGIFCSRLKKSAWILSGRMTGVCWKRMKMRKRLSCMPRLASTNIGRKLHMMKQGKYVGGFAPYGYALHPKVRNKLAVDPEAAAVVRRIFMEAAEGCRTGLEMEVLK